MKIEISNPEELYTLVSSSPALLLYFFNDSCAPCVALRPKVEQLVSGEFPKMKHAYINAALHPLMSASNNVFASPTIIAFFDGKETFRVSKYIFYR